jgi:small conductance mechanosensitive channel
MDRILEPLASAMNPLIGVLPQIVAGTLALLIFVAMGRAVALAANRVIARGQRADGYAGITRRVIRWAFGLVGLVMALQILGLTAVATSLLATGGLVAVILGFAFREIGENLLAGLFLGLSRSFEVGDLIESSGHTGRVQNIELRHVHLRSADGRDIFVPSAQIFRNVLVNFTRDGLQRGEFLVGIDYRDSSEDARAVLQEATEGVPHVLPKPSVAVTVSGFTPNYVELTVHFWVDTSRGPGLLQIRSAVMQACLGALIGGGFTLSAEVSSAVTLSPLDVALREPDGKLGEAGSGQREPQAGAPEPGSGSQQPPL